MLTERISKLLTIKSIVTLALTGLFVGLAATGEIPQEVMTVFTTVIGFYFGTQTVKE